MTGIPAEISRRMTQWKYTAAQQSQLLRLNKEIDVLILKLVIEERRSEEKLTMFYYFVNRISHLTDLGY